MLTEMDGRCGRDVIKKGEGGLMAVVTIDHVLEGGVESVDTNPRLLA
jgi:hypothetical protein